MSTNPREFRVQRLTPGVTWDSWTYTYHSNIVLARDAAGRFFRGEGNYRPIHHDRNPHNYDSNVVIWQQDGHYGNGFTRWKEIESYPYSQWAAFVAAAPEVEAEALVQEVKLIQQRISELIASAKLDPQHKHMHAVRYLSDANDALDSARNHFQVDANSLKGSTR